MGSRLRTARKELLEQNAQWCTTLEADTSFKNKSQSTKFNLKGLGVHCPSKLIHARNTQCQRNYALSFLHEGVSISLPLCGHSGQCWHPPQPEPALPEATFPHWQVQGTVLWKESSLHFWPSLVLPHQRWLSWTRLSFSPAFLTALCKPRE